MKLPAGKSTLYVSGLVGLLMLAPLGAQAPTVTITPANPALVLAKPILCREAWT